MNKVLLYQPLYLGTFSFNWLSFRIVGKHHSARTPCVYLNYREAEVQVLATYHNKEGVVEPEHGEKCVQQVWADWGWGWGSGEGGGGVIGG